MPLMDEFREEREEVKNRSFKERMKYFWDYYKWHVIGSVIAVFAVISLILTFVTRKDTAYYSAFINMAENWSCEDYKKEFAALAGINLKKHAMYFDSDLHMDLANMDQTTFTAVQKIMVYISAKELDSMLADGPAMNRYAYNDVFMDLRDFLTEEEMAKYEPYFYYMDRALVDQQSEELNTDVDYPADPTDPSAMTDPVPVGIYLHDCKKLSEAYFYGNNQCFAVLINSSHTELNHVFLNFIMEN